MKDGKFLTMAIESSCDETAAALVNEKREILAETVLSQEEHKIYGGVVPEIAARSHLDHIDDVIEHTFHKAGIRPEEVDAIAATSGPGLIGGVVVGAMAAKALAFALGKPFVAVNHLEGHALVSRLTNEVEYPYLLLLVSGGHCQILAVKGVGDYERLGTTIDDAAGEAFDKAARVIGIPYPGGPLLDMNGNVVGIASAKYSGTTASGASIENVSFAVPIHDALEIAYDLQQYGYVRGRAYLGVTVRDLDGKLAADYGLPVGPRVESVTEGSCAAKAGIQQGDFILSVDGRKTETTNSLLSALLRHSAGETVGILLYRAGAHLTVAVTLDERPQTVQQPSDEPPAEIPDN